MEVIDYKNSLINLSNSILKYFDVTPYHETLTYIDEILLKNQYKNVVVLLCDGLGSKNLVDCLKKDNFLRKNKVRDITSVFPPTTTAATTSLLTGKMPSEHNWFGWDVYFKDTNETISLYLNKDKDTHELPKLDISKREYMKYVSIIDLINNKTSNKAYYASPFDFLNPCKTMDEVVKRIFNLCNKDGKKFIYGYIENPDKLMHHCGIYSKKVKEEVELISKKIEELSKLLTNTLLIVTADHGLVSSQYINLKKDRKDIYDMLERTTSIESRACGIKLKKNVKKEEFENKFHLYFKNDFLLLSNPKVMNMHLFGTNQNQYLKDTIGDYLMIATGHLSINYDESSPTFKANHAGLTKDEILVPLIVIDCKKEI